MYEQTVEEEGSTCKDMQESLLVNGVKESKLKLKDYGTNSIDKIQENGRAANGKPNVSEISTKIDMKDNDSETKPHQGYGK